MHAFLFITDEILEYILNLIPRTLQRFIGVHDRLREVVESHENQVSRESGLRVFRTLQIKKACTNYLTQAVFK